jgi:hypothetical protein
LRLPKIGPTDGAGLLCGTRRDQRREETEMIGLHFEAKTTADLYHQIRDLVGPAVIEGYLDDALLAEVRQRMAKKGFVVQLKSFKDK